MKHLLWSIVATMAVLVAAVTGCGRAPRYDARLVAIDSLMHDAPDSALALVQAIGTLPAPADRAYRDLLLTQARYRCYVTATSDSDINRALAYYRGHSGEREKLTRAFIYKGAVMDELGHPDSAMLYYKHAEATAAPDDYFNLGYAKMRIADLYITQISQDSSAIIRLHEAKHYFGLLQDTSFVISTLKKLGAICGDLYPDSAIQYLSQAIALAQQYNPSLQYSPKSTLAGVVLFQGDYNLAKELSIDIINNGVQYCDETQFYYYAAWSYAKMGQTDSARHILDISPPPADDVDSLAYYNATAEIHRAEGNPQLYSRDLANTKKIAINVLTNTQEEKLTSSETDFARQQAVSRNKTLNWNNTWLSFSIILAVVAIFIISLIVIRIKNRNTAIKKENALIQHELELTLARLEQQQISTCNNSVSELVSKRLSAIQELYNDIRVKWDDNSKVKKIIPLSGLLSSLHERRLLMRVELKDSFWKKMKQSVNGELKGIVTYAERQYPELTEDDIKMFCLLCAKISPQIIRLCMNFDSAKTVTNYRSKLIKKKMGLDMTFDEFVYKYLNNELKN